MAISILHIAVVLSLTQHFSYALLLVHSLSVLQCWFSLQLYLSSMPVAQVEGASFSMLTGFCSLAQSTGV